MQGEGRVSVAANPSRAARRQESRHKKEKDLIMGSRCWITE
jgi:hypothetical protein